MREQSGLVSCSTAFVSNLTDTDSTSSSQPLTDELSSDQISVECASNSTMDEDERETKTTSAGDRPRESAPVNLCVICLAEEKQIAHLPCGHLTTCVLCGHSLLSCPICQTKIDGFVRIYI